VTLLKRLIDAILRRSSPLPEYQPGVATLFALQRLHRGDDGVAIVFTDIVDSTALVTQIGDVRWSRVLDEHLARCKELVARNRGARIDRTGDGILCAFGRVANAFEFSRALQASPGNDLIRIRAGIHYGKLHFRDVGVCGQLVHFGARVVSHGKGAEIWLSEPARNQLALEAEDLVRNIGWSCDEECELKGIPGLHTLWRFA
jgi:class 3 adenylate cyclase